MHILQNFSLISLDFGLEQPTCELLAFFLAWFTVKLKRITAILYL